MRKYFLDLGMYWIYMGIAIISLIILLNGCGEQTDPLKPTSTKVQIVERKVIVACEIPKIECEFSGEGFIPTKKLLECVKIQKEALRICTEKKDEVVEEKIINVDK